MSRPRDGTASQILPGAPRHSGVHQDESVLFGFEEKGVDAGQPNLVQSGLEPADPRGGRSQRRSAVNHR